jgi:GT2 family glycosyltransferase
VGEPEAVDVSVVIPCFNHGGYLPEAIASAEAAQGVRVELIVVDDGSTEPATLEVLGGLARSGYHVIRQSNRGLSAARNTGIAAARGRYILPLDSDNRIRPDYLRVGASILDHGPEIGVVYGDCEMFGAASGRQGEVFSFQRLLVANFIDACAIFRKQVWEECGGYDTGMPDQLGWEDWDFWIQAARRGWQFVHVPEPMFDYRVRPDSMAQRCNLPENHGRLVRYLALKHRDAYASYFPEVVVAHAQTAAADRLDVLRLRREEARYQAELADLQDQVGAVTAALRQVEAEVVRGAEAYQAVVAEREAARADLVAAHVARTPLERELVQARQEIAALRQAYEGSREQYGQVARRCAELQETVLQMRASLFWRLRGVWVRLRRLRDPHWS